MPKLLLADDDETLVSNIADWLKLSDYQVDVTYSVDETVSMMNAFEYDLIMLDWEFPDGAGINIVSNFRGKGGLTPILMLTGKSSIDDKERGLDVGADDYMTKPFHMKELGARIRALLRRPPVVKGDELRVGKLSLKVETRTAYLGQEEIKLQPMEFSVLEFFMRNPGKPFSPEKIIERVWDSSTDVSLHAVYSCMKRLRKKLDKPGFDSMFRTVPGVGYELVQPGS